MEIVVSIISWLVFGLIVGAIARLILPGRQAMSWIMTALLGVAGSFVGGGISWLIFGTSDNGIHPAGWILSIIGALLVVFIYSRFKGAKAA